MHRPFTPILDDNNAHSSIEIALSATNQVVALPSFAAGAQAEMIITGSAQIRFGAVNTISAVTANRASCLAYDMPVTTLVTVPQKAAYIAATGSGTLRLHFGNGL